MGTTKPAAFRESFILRIWREEGQPGWRGWVQHVHSGESALFQNLADLLAFVEQRIEASTARGSSTLR